MSPEGVVIPKAYQLGFPTTKSITEYEAFIAGLRAALCLDVREGHSRFKAGDQPSSGLIED